MSDCPEWKRQLREWIREHPWCSVCGAHGVQKHHVTSRGKLRGKSDLEQDRENVAPVCPPCHTSVHSLGRPEFERRNNVDLRAIAVYVWQEAMKGYSFNDMD